MSFVTWSHPRTLSKVITYYHLNLDPSNSSEFSHLPQSLILFSLQDISDRLSYSLNKFKETKKATQPYLYILFQCPKGITTCHGLQRVSFIPHHCLHTSCRVLPAPAAANFETAETAPQSLLVSSQLYSGTINK